MSPLGEKCELLTATEVLLSSLLLNIVLAIRSCCHFCFNHQLWFIKLSCLCPYFYSFLSSISCPCSKISSFVISSLFEGLAWLVFKGRSGSSKLFKCFLIRECFHFSFVPEGVLPDTEFTVKSLLSDWKIMGHLHLVSDEKSLSLKLLIVLSSLADFKILFIFIFLYSLFQIPKITEC